MQKTPVAPYHCEVDRFKKGLIRAALESHRGNRTHAARALGLQRTYLLRLIREFGLKTTIPPPVRAHADTE